MVRWTIGKVGAAAAAAAAVTMRAVAAAAAAAAARATVQEKESINGAAEMSEAARGGQTRKAVARDTSIRVKTAVRAAIAQVASTAKRESWMREYEGT